jgi:putative peptide zinc metalloprotease protein
MDWLEIPNLRGRGLAWVSNRLRRRPPAWAALDREGRIVALYGVLALLWVGIAANLAYRIWADRVAGLVTGLWHGGAAGQLLLVAVVLGLCAPLVYLAVGRIARWWRVSRQRAAERQREVDAPRRLAALRASDLGGLPENALADLVARARWLRPPSGTQLVVAGGTQQAVYVVVDGAMQARRPGDPGGTIRHHVGAGGVVGLANALTGRATSLDWHTAGTTLLSVPTATVASVVGPLPGPPPADRAEAEALFADTPALAGLAGDARLALIASAHPVDLEPGAPVLLPGPTHAVVVESGVIGMPDGVELRRGTLVGPVGDGNPGMVAQTRTPVRLWVIPDASDLPPLVGSPGQVAAGPTGSGPAASGVHSAGVYPPLAVPPGPPDGSEDPEVDRRFERRMWWLVTLLLLFALLLTAGNFAPGPAWAEMPTNRALLTSDRGTITATIDGKTVALAEGDRRYVDEGARIRVPDKTSARLTFQGGGAALFCAGSQAQVGKLFTDAGRKRVPHGALTVEGGRLLADTASTSGAYEPLALTVSRSADVVTNSGPAWYAVEPDAISVATGRVYVAGALSHPTGADLSCGDGVKVEPPAGSPSQSPSDEPLPTDLPTPSPTLSSVPPTEATTVPVPTVDPTTPDAPAPTTTRATTRPTTAPPPTTRPTTAPPTTTAPPPTTPRTTPPTTPPSSAPASQPDPTTSTTEPIG